jgi:cytochrome d ubiquinol oxidase subunit I
VYGLIKTAEVASQTPAPQIALTLAAYLSVYGVLVVSYIGVLRHLAAHAAETLEQGEAGGVVVGSQAVALVIPRPALQGDQP